MPGNPYWPIVGLPLSEWQAALAAIERVLPQIDNRLMEVRRSGRTVLSWLGQVR